MSRRRVLAALLALLAAGPPLTACDADDPRGDSAGFCAVYTAQRDAPPEGATAYADELAATGPPAGLDDPARSGFDVYLAYLRDQGDGQDEGLYEDQYATVLQDPARTAVRAFVATADDRCGVVSPSAGAPADAARRDYCRAFTALFEPRRSDLLRRTGTPRELGGVEDFAVEARSGFEAVADAFATLTPAQAEVYEAGEDDAVRRLVGVTDAFAADTWFLVSYGLCLSGGEG